MSLSESIVEDAALTRTCLYAFGEVGLVGRWREAIRRLNPAIPQWSHP